MSLPHNGFLAEYVFKTLFFTGKHKIFTIKNFERITINGSLLQLNERNSRYFTIYVRRVINDNAIIILKIGSIHVQTIQSIFVLHLRIEFMYTSK